ncbi:MAG: anti-sigma factor [Pyrinomonadaceae bacterium]
MYDCHETKEFLEFYLDSELDAVQTRRVSDHLEGCRSCSRELEVLRSQNELVSRAIRSVKLDSRSLRASIEAATIAKRQRLIPWSLPRIPTWGTVTALAIVVIFASVFYLPTFIGVNISPLFEAAAENHRVCIHDSEAPDWARTPAAVSELEETFVGHNRRVPDSTADYRLVRARVCIINGERFLHLVYENHGGQEASLFVGQKHVEPLHGDRTLSMEGIDVQLALFSDLHVSSTEVGTHLLITTAHEDRVAAGLLLGAAASLRT